MRIIYQEETFLVCVKPSGISSEEGPCGMPELLRKEGNCKEVYPVHRLDRAVSGLMVYALTKEAAGKLTKQIQEKIFQKKYLAMVKGVPDPREGRMDDLLLHIAKENKTYVVKRMRKGVREASLTYETIAEKNGYSLEKITLLTGRTHQIRAQFSSRKMPLYGDRKYGDQNTGDIALWSYELSFFHPESGEQMTFTENPPAGEPWIEIS